MKQLILDVLEDMSTGQINLASKVARETIANTIIVAIKTKGGWSLDLSTYNGRPKIDMPVYKKTDEEKAKATWVCSICGKNTYDVDWDYIGSGTNHLGCELEDEKRVRSDRRKSDRREKNWVQKKHEKKVFPGVDAIQKQNLVDKLSEEIVDNDTGYIYESPDGGKTVYKRKFGSDKREKIDWKKIKKENKK